MTDENVGWVLDEVRTTVLVTGWFLIVLGLTRANITSLSLIPLWVRPVDCFPWAWTPPFCRRLACDGIYVRSVFLSDSPQAMF